MEEELTEEEKLEAWAVFRKEQAKLTREEANTNKNGEANPSNIIEGENAVGAYEPLDLSPFSSFASQEPIAAPETSPQDNNFLKRKTDSESGSSAKKPKG